MSEPIDECEQCDLDDLVGKEFVLKEKYDQLQAKLDIYEKALEFYADKSQMNHGIDFGDDETGFINEDDFDSIFKFDKWSEHDYYVYGKRARQALEDAKKVGIKSE